MRNQCNDSNQEHVRGGPSRREALITGAAMVAAPFVGGVSSAAEAAEAAHTMPVDQARKVRGTAAEWLNYAGDKASSKYSPSLR
jgi:hypothetical protein